MDKKSFFEGVEEEIGSSPEAQRFLSELQDHLDDASSNHPQRSDSAVQQLGEPKTVASSFYQYMLQKNIIFALADTLFVSILSVTLFVGIFFGVFAFLSLLLTLDLSASPRYLIEQGVIGGLSLLLLIVIYMIRTPRAIIESPTRASTATWMLLLFSFPYATLFYLAWRSFISSPEPTDQNAVLLSAMILILGSIGLVLTAKQRVLRSRARAIQKKRKTSSATPSSPRLVRNITTLLGVLTLGYILLVRIYSWMIVSSTTFGEWAYTLQGDIPPYLKSLFEALQIITMPLTILEIMVSNILIYSDARSPFTLSQWYWLIGSVLTLLILTAGVQLVRAFRRRSREPFPWLSLIIVVQGVTLLWGTPSGHLDIEMNVPSASISEIIERRQLGPFYGFVNYANSLNAGYGRYAATWKDGRFVVEQYGSDEKTYLFFIDPPASADKVSVRSVSRDIKAQDLFTEDVDAPFECAETIPSAYEYDAQDFCTVMTYHGKTIFTVKNPRSIWMHDSVISSDGQWGMIIVKINIDTAYDVYLLDLRGV